ncbi:MAG TPA: hypothetical protein VLV16_08000 [Gemmatimonadales bacterium]|nr:hypothetical protein [Gemmatimonadales bacterium]
MDRESWRLYGAVAACAILVYLGALSNRWALDDLQIILGSTLVHSSDGWWKAFGTSYWPPEVGAYLYRPLTVATYVLDWHLDGPALFHAVNILWHAAASVLVSVLARRWINTTAALVAGVLFAVHPLHVEAVAQVVGRAELMATVFTLLMLYAAIERRSVAWSTACWILALLCKENAAVAPGLIALAWAAGIGRPPRRAMFVFCASWVVAGAAYGVVRHLVLRQYDPAYIIAAVFVGQHPTPARLTAVAAWSDIFRLLVFPLQLRADYSPNERSIVTSPFDPRFVIGLLCGLVWVCLAIVAWQRGRKIEAFGLGWVPFAFAPVSNLLFPVGILIAERTLYLPSVGLAIAVGGAARQLRGRPLMLLVAALAVLGGIRSALRVPVWETNVTATLSILEDSPRSYVGPMIMASIYLEQSKPEKALQAARVAIDTFPLESRPYMLGAHAALMLEQYGVADSFFMRVNRFCNPCRSLYETEATVARRLGSPTVADTLLAHARRLTRP